MDAAVKNREALDEGIAGSDIFSPTELLWFKSRLLEKKSEIIDQEKVTIGSNRIKLDANEMKDDVDIASVSIEQDLTFRLLDRSRKLLREIDHALKKIHTGDYGYCEGTGEIIPKKRLELTPWVRHSVEHKSILEKHKKLLKSKPEDQYAFFK
ncbi:MAG: TraR/DksA C4-type zinc finger protein [Deltaproteobacteria bacterium]|nr:TraR/DksA C4-type zinc finger protein [Deltaproteobacteria bacterium]